MKLATMTRGGNVNGCGGAFGQALQTVLEPEGGDGGQSGVLFAFGAYLSVCFLFVSYILFSFYINFLLALFSFSDFVYFAGRACAPALNYL